MENPADTVYIQIKDYFRIKIFLERTTIQIETALVRWANPIKKEAGFYFNLNDHNMLAENQANLISDLVLRQINGILDSKGKGFDLNFQKLKI